MSVADKLLAVANNVPRVFAAGEVVASAKCAAKHYVAEAVGNGTSAITFNIPFEPDCISISSFNPFAIAKADQLIFVIYDLRSFGKLAGIGAYCTTDSGATKLLLFSQGSAAGKFIIENGCCTVKNLGTSSVTGNQVVFNNGENYLVTAVKYTETTEKEDMEEYINSLSDDGGSIVISQMKKEANFTEEEWQTLIAAKPDWTFSLV